MTNRTATVNAIPTPLAKTFFYSDPQSVSKSDVGAYSP